jgi:pyruvate/2-oxoglutarate/acetoin dehydrogenase E1 component
MSRQIPLVLAINEAFSEEMARNDKIFIIGEDVQAGVFGASRGLVQKFGKDRVMDTPLAETVIAGAAVGASMAGYHPVADFMFADFMWCAADEIFLKAAKWHFIHGGKVNLPVVLFANVGGGARLGPEHSQCPESVVMHTPGLKLVFPSCSADAKGLLKTALRDPNPVVYFYHKRMLGLMGEVPDGEYTIPFGKADVKKEGKDVTVVAIGLMVQHALSVAKELEGKISVEVVDPRTLEPLDIETIISSVKKTGRVVIADEDTKRCGVTAEIGMQIIENAFDSLDAPIQRVAAANYPLAGAYMEEFVLPKPSDIKTAIEAVVKK